MASAARRVASSLPRASTRYVDNVRILLAVVGGLDIVTDNWGYDVSP